MPISILDAQDAAQKAKVETQGWMEEFVREWMGPYIALQEAKTSDQIIRAWDSMPEDLRRQVAEREPKMASALNELKKKRGMNGSNR